MSEIASFEDLTGGEAEIVSVDLAGGKSVRVRGLSRYEYMLAGKQSQVDGETDVNAFEGLIVLYGTVEPKLSRGQVEAWQKAPGRSADFHRVDREIMRLSGLNEGADKSDLRDVRSES
jgi:predicted lipoprotein